MAPTLGGANQGSAQTDNNPRSGCRMTRPPSTHEGRHAQTGPRPDGVCSTSQSRGIPAEYTWQSCSGRSASTASRLLKTPAEGPGPPQLAGPRRRVSRSEFEWSFEAVSKRCSELTELAAKEVRGPRHGEQLVTDTHELHREVPVLKVRCDAGDVTRCLGASHCDSAASRLKE
jgi:hypothetical protein